MDRVWTPPPLVHGESGDHGLVLADRRAEDRSARPGFPGKPRKPAFNQRQPLGLQVVAVPTLRDGRSDQRLIGQQVAFQDYDLLGIIGQYARRQQPEAWQRHLGVFMAGLRPASEPLPCRVLSREELDELIANRLASCP